MDSSSSFPPFRTWLTSRDDVYLTELMRRRPDVVSPPPKSTDVLAARLQLRVSVQRALPQLSATALAALEAAVRLGGDDTAVAAESVASMVRESLADAAVPVKERPTVAHIRGALDELRQMGLIYGDGPGASGAFSGRARKSAATAENVDHLMVPAGVWESLPPGWRILPDASQRSPEEVRNALEGIDAKQRRLLGTLVESGGLGTTKDADPAADPSLPVPRLISLGLLDRVDDSTVRLPSVVAAVLRGIPLPSLPVPLRPREPETVPADRVDERAVGNVLDHIRGVRELLSALGDRPAGTVKDGSLGVREQRRLTEEMGPELPRYLASALSAGLVAVNTPKPLPKNDTGGDYLAPTEAADTFLSGTSAQQWAMLVNGVWTSEEYPAAVDDGTHLLSPESRLSGLPALRTMLSDVLIPTGDNALSDLRGELALRRPLLSIRTGDDLLQEVLTELTSLGLVVTLSSGAVAATTAWRAAVELGDEEYVGKLGTLLPQPATYLIPQADQTILVPGPAEPAMGAMLARFAVLESPGMASVYRVTEASVRGALDAGSSAAEIRDFLTERSMGPVPQSLTYLVDDVARRHGLLRGGPAISYLRCDDAAALAAVMASPDAEHLGLRRLADTVVISQVPLAQVIETLRSAGHPIVAEDASGATLDLSDAPSRVPAPRRSPAPTGPTVDEALIAKAVDTLTQGDRASQREAEPDSDSRASGEQAQALLQRAVRSGLDVTVSFVDRNGTAGVRRVRPVTVGGGQVDAIDPASGKVHRFLLHRITEVVLER